jgi:enamine deaminase RidA (YjgF/YER057c/UK114 family)
MRIDKINPDTLFPPHGYAQVTVATGNRIIQTSGQVACDLEENILALGDYQEQARLAALNVYAAVTGAGATPADITRLMVYVVDPSPANLDLVYAGLGKAAREARAKLTAMTLVGATGFSHAGVLVELDATAVVD